MSALQDQIESEELLVSSYGIVAHDDRPRFEMKGWEWRRLPTIEKWIHCESDPKRGLQLDIWGHFNHFKEVDDAISGAYDINRLTAHYIQSESWFSHRFLDIMLVRMRSLRNLFPYDRLVEIAEAKQYPV